MVVRRFGTNLGTFTVDLAGMEELQGKSAYDLWLEQGHAGTVEDFYTWLAEQAAALVAPVEGEPGPGSEGPSAYEVAVANGFVGTEAQWLASLVGPAGPPGTPGLVWRGTWNNATSYVTGDGVELNGSSYIALQGSTNNNPESSPTRWQLIAAKGAQGNPGPGVPAGGTTNQVLAKTSNADYATGWVTPSSGGSGPTLVKLTADQTFLTTGLANVTGLVFPVTAGTLYRFTFFAVFRSSLATAGARLGLTLPAFTTYTGSVRIAGRAADGTDSEFVGALTTSGDSVVSSAVAATNTDFLAVVEGVLLPSANGNLQLQAAPEVAATLTVRNGSHGQLWTV